MRFLDLAVVVHQQIGAVAVQHAGRAARDRSRVQAGRGHGRPLRRRRSRRDGRRGTDETGPSRSSRRRCRRSANPAAGLRPPASARAFRCRSRIGSRAPSSDRDAGPPPCRCNRKCLSTLVTQSRSASFIASFSVLEPDCTGTHFRAQHLHAEHVRLLPLDIDRAHVDDARQARSARRASRSRRRACRRRFRR